MGGAATDRWGVPVHAGGDRGVALLDDAVEALVALAGTPAAHSAAAADADGDLALAVIVGAYLALYGASPEGVATARALLGRLGGSLPRREACHLQAARAWADGELGRALGALEQALVRHPRDLLALKIAQDLYFATGQSPALRDVAGRVLAAWPVGHPGWGYVQGMYAFGLEENGQYREAEERARAALAHDRRDVWAAHALAHVFEMEGRAQAGVDFLRSSAPDWRSSFFAVHNWWHRALCHLELGQIGEVLALYDGPIRGAGSNLWLDLDDAASVLWRLSLYGIGLGERAHALASAVDPLVSEPVAVFNDWHAVMALGLAGHHQRNREILAANRERSVGTNRAAGEQAGFALLEGFGAFATGRFDRAIELLVGLAPAAQVVGGSHAQRDVLNLTVIAAAARSGDTRLAAGLAADRVAAKPAAAGATRRLLEANGAPG
ncbi:MAG: tetratricopeptide repeat protein [Acidimicrobiales bacterium]